MLYPAALSTSIIVSAPAAFSDALSSRWLRPDPPPVVEDTKRMRAGRGRDSAAGSAGERRFCEGTTVPNRRFVRTLDPMR